ncbi:spore germination protein [Clostridium estertheticum]|uniref:Spore germination protein n=2 Tax=Clostridium estertheticum TaxID=238834 RepID=A0A1J0GMD8_9CLOT|nr:spore germination protein [Clostridium estertheticum]APC42586.1 spore germination protein [Clostridium estertheticum subsp. estertheticum]MBU3072156.1 spore germination protein [Clostridium estertheticum]MBU3162248.1 spore germination protein [Clostridium estertheticum]MBU3170679.1 spore germination protein [Clostridium estertheticum]MBZ9614499.1 spore germination protein [Clostridium estertheticum subsp. laramiense]
MENGDLNGNIDLIRNGLGKQSPIVVKHFYIGSDQPLEAAIIYINGIADKDIIDRDILNPLMIHIGENLNGRANIGDYLCKRYISMSNTLVESDLNGVVNHLKRGKTAVLINGALEVIIADTTGGVQRAIMEPMNETAAKGPRDGFVENLEVNISLIRRKVKDKNLNIELFNVGSRLQSDLAMVYIEDIVDKHVLEELKKRIEAIDLDAVLSAGKLEQYIEDYAYTVFPQAYSTERPDRAIGNMLEGRIVLIIEGTPMVLVYPAIFMQFFQAVEDYTERTVVSSFVRLLRILAAIIVITLPSIYLTLIKFNVELIPIKFVTPIVQSRVGIALTPFLEITAMELVVEFLREGGLRLPTKIAQTLSLVGGIIIGDTAIQSKMVSPTTLLIVGITVITTFLIPNYDMSLSIRMLRFPMLVLANIMGIFGIAVGWFLILVHLSSLDSLGVPYFEFHKNDMKDTFIRAPLWKMNKRPEGIPNSDPIRQTDFRNKFKKKR